MTFGWTIIRGLHRQGQTEAPALFTSTELDESGTWLSMRFLFSSFPTTTFSKDTHREMATRNGSWSQTLPLPLSVPLSFLPNMRILHMVVHFKDIPCFAHVWVSNRPLNYNCSIWWDDFSHPIALKKEGSADVALDRVWP